jgi:DUF1365 family protein
MMPRSGLYAGRVVHTRLRPRRHRLSYACYWLLLDLDHLETLSRTLRFFSLDRFNLFSLRNADHGTGSDVSIRAQAHAHLANAGIDASDGKLFLMAMPRVLGYGFNPLSVYYFIRNDGRAGAVMYEVHNTFGERHSYLVPVTTDALPIRQRCDKQFYVSPFLPMDLTYDFEVTVPGRHANVSIRAADRDGLILSASLTAQRQELTDRNLLTAFVTHPLLTLKVIVAIHWEALRLWRKGLGLVPRPPAPEHSVTASSSSPLTKAVHD